MIPLYEILAVASTVRCSPASTSIALVEELSLGLDTFSVYPPVIEGMLKAIAGDDEDSRIIEDIAISSSKTECFIAVSMCDEDINYFSYFNYNVIAIIFIKIYSKNVWL